MSAVPPPAGAVRVTIGGGRSIAVLDRGAGLPVVLLHGFPLDRSMWAGQWPLAGSVRLVVPDLPGFGESDGPPSESVAGMADDVAALLDGLGIASGTVVCGLSMGGYVAQHLAARHRHRLAGLVLVDTKLEADSPEARAARADLAARVQRHGARLAAEAMLPRLFARGPAAALDRGAAPRREIEAGVRRVIEATPVETIRTALRALADRPDMTAAAAGFDLPALLVAGEEDEITPPALLEGAARIMPRARLVVVPGCGHMTPLESPTRFNEELAAFLARLAPGR